MSLVEPGVEPSNGGLPQTQELGTALLSRPLNRGKMLQGGGGWSVVQSRPRARARGQGGGPGAGPGGGGEVGAGERGGGAGTEGRGAAGARGHQGEQVGGGRGGGDGGQGRGRPRPSLPRANLEPREHTAALLMEEFQTLPTEDELGQWIEKEVFKEDIAALAQVLEGFKALRTD